MKSLADKEFHVEGNWYAPRNKLKDYSSVVKVELYDTTSSAGDWSGFFVQKMGEKRYDVLLFNQHNNWPHSGFKVQTQLLCSSKSILSTEQIFDIINKYI